MIYGRRGKCYERIPNIQVSNYLMDQTQLNKLENPKDKVTQEKLLETNVLLDKWAKPAMTRRVLRKTTNGEHLTMIKKDYGIKRGVVEELTAFQLGTYCILGKLWNLYLNKIRCEFIILFNFQNEWNIQVQYQILGAKL